MAVEAVASVVIQKLTDMLIEEESVSNEKLIVHQLEEIKKALEEMEWSEEYLKYVCYVEDIIESFALRIARQRRRLGFLMNYALFLKNFTACRKLSRKMNRIRVNIRLSSRRSLENHLVPITQSADNFDEKGTVAEEQKEEDNDEAEKEESPLRTSTDLENHTEKPQLQSLSVASLLSECLKLDMIGFRSDVSYLVRSLKKPRNKSLSIISIVGKMGSGKTTLARKVFEDRQIKSCFKCCAWLTVPKEATAIDLLLKLLKQVSNSKDQGGLISEDKLQTRLFERLNDKKYLIVLDDLWGSHIWDYLKNAFPNDRNGSKIIITSQKQVAVDIESRLHTLKKMSHEDCWTLFKKKAGLEEGPDDLRKMMLQVSNRLPLNVVLLGSLLATKKEDGSAHEWQEILERQTRWETNEILSLCYDDVPVPLKLCLLYMVLFPKEYDIPVRRLLRLWQAEGLVKRADIFPEDEAQKYLDNLVKRSLIRVSKLRSDGSPKKCRLLGVLHDHLSPRAMDLSLFHVHCKPGPCGDNKPFGVLRQKKPFGVRRQENPFGVRRLVEYTDLQDCSFYPDEIGGLRSYLSFNVQKKDTPAKEVGNLLDHIIRNGKSLLRVLDLEGVYKPSLPENLGDFFHLRYLGLRWTFLDSLPQSVGDLCYLETLDVKHTHIDTLPPSIWKLKHLRRLNLNEIRLDMGRNLKRPIPQLLTLWGLSVDDKSMVELGLNRLLCLRELGITFHLSSCEELLDWISQLKDLQMLRLRSKDDECRPSKLVLKPLSNLGNLSNLNLLGSLTRLPEKEDFPQGVKVLTLSVSQLQDDPMPILGQLPCLTVLRLLAASYMGKRMICKRGGFKELRVLKLWMLEKLVTWDVEEQAMEKLKALNIRCCKKLKSMPVRLLRQSNFKELTLTNMPRKLRKQVENERRKFNQFSIIVKDFKSL